MKVLNQFETIFEIIMKLTTTFWTSEIHTFDKLLYIDRDTKQIMYMTDLNNTFESYVFFKKLSDFVMRPDVRMAYPKCYQFAVSKDNKVCPIKWFNLEINDSVISHDIAFETTLIRKNQILIPFLKPLQV